MCKFSKVPLAIDITHTTTKSPRLQTRLRFVKPVLLGPTIPLLMFTVSMANISTSLPDVQIGISMTAVADVSKEQTDMSYKGELHSLN